VRAYLRLDPGLVDMKAGYPDGAFRAFVEVLCFAEQQPTRGVFRNRKLLAVLLDKRARWIAYLIDHADLIPMATGHLVVEGWQEWQEGDWKVAERMKRVRGRERPDTAATVTNDTAGNVSVPSSGKRLAVGGRQIAEAGAPRPRLERVHGEWREKAS
jgi:hypothetical protein